MTTFLLILLVIGLTWVAALEVRFHTLKNAVPDSEELAHEVAAHLKQIFETEAARLQDKPTPKPTAKRKS